MKRVKKATNTEKAMKMKDMIIKKDDELYGIKHLHHIKVA